MRETLETIGERVSALAKSTEAGFANVDDRFANIDGQFVKIDGRTATIDERFDTLEKNIDEAFAEQRAYTETAFNALGGEMKELPSEVKELREDMTGMRRGFGRLERKLDNLIIAPPRRSRRGRRG